MCQSHEISVLKDDLNFPCPPSPQSIQEWRKQTAEYFNTRNSFHFQTLFILEKASFEQSRSQKKSEDASYAKALHVPLNFLLIFYHFKTEMKCLK